MAYKAKQEQEKYTPALRNMLIKAAGHVEEEQIIESVDPKYKEEKMAEDAVLFQEHMKILGRGGAYVVLWDAIGSYPKDKLDIRGPHVWSPSAGPIIVPKSPHPHHIYYCNATTNKKLGPGNSITIKNASAINAVMVDMDIGKPIKVFKDRIFDNQEKILEYLEGEVEKGTFPYPSEITDSGGGLHCLWFLEEPFILINEDGTTNQEAVTFAKTFFSEWVDLVGGDPGAKDLVRQLRVPGSTNWKREYKGDWPIIQYIHNDFTLYPIDQLVALLPPMQPKIDEKLARMKPHRDPKDFQPLPDAMQKNVVPWFRSGMDKLLAELSELTTGRRVALGSKALRVGNIAALPEVPEDFIDELRQDLIDVCNVNGLSDVRSASDIETWIEYCIANGQVNEPAKLPPDIQEYIDSGYVDQQQVIRNTLAKSNGTGPQSVKEVVANEENTTPDEQDHIVEAINDVKETPPAPSSYPRLWQDIYNHLKTASTMSPPEHLRAGTYSVLSSLIARRVYHPQSNLYPNLYTLLLGDPGISKKSTLLNAIERLITLGGMPIIGAMTPEALEKDLGLIDPPGQNEGHDIWLKERQFYAQRPMVLDEASFLFDSWKRKDHMARSKPQLLQLFDCKEITRGITTVGRGRRDIYKAYMPFLGVSTPQAFKNELASGADGFGEGMWSRFQVVYYADLPPFKFYDDNRYVPDDLVVQLNRLNGELLQIPRAYIRDEDGDEHKGKVEVEPLIVHEIDLAPDAYREWEDYTRHVDQLMRDDRNSNNSRHLGEIYSRLHVHAFKHAMLLSVCDWVAAYDRNEPLRMERTHWDHGMEDVERVREDFLSLLDHVDQIKEEIDEDKRAGNMRANAQKLLAYLRKSPDNQARKSKVKQRFQRWGEEGIIEALKYLGDEVEILDVAGQKGHIIPMLKLRSNW